MNKFWGAANFRFKCTTDTMCSIKFAGMIVLDFLFYYLTYWFDQRNYLLSWSSSRQRSSYALGLAAIAIFFALGELLDFTVFKNQNFHYAKYIFIIVALVMMQLFDFIYIRKKRYESINPATRFRFLIGISDEIKSRIAIFFIVLSLLLPILILVLFVPFGKHTLGY